MQQTRKVRKIQLRLSKAFSMLRTCSVLVGNLAARHAPCTISCMLFFLFGQAFSLLLDLIWLGQRPEQDKDVEIVRHEVV